ncbi:putative ABC transport system permease protein [Burkholderia sp. D7]|nr:putative ABC transport system permease protein [Burkholderia sp. D7]
MSTSGVGGEQKQTSEQISKQDSRQESKQGLGFVQIARQSLRMTVRDWRAGELTMLILALVLAVAALASVGFLGDRMRQGLERDARQMIAADFVVRADHPVDPAFAAEAAQLKLETATTAIFPSMISAGVSGNASTPPVARLAALKAVSPGYPLRGVVRIATAVDQPGTPATSIPAPGTVWVDPALLDALKVPVGGTVRVGTRPFKVAAVITRELDRGFSFVSFSPRLMMREDELASTGLVTFGSRVTYRLLVAGPDAQVKQFATFARAKVDDGKLRGVALESLQDGQPQVRQTIDRASHFLTLVSLLTALLAAVAIAMASHRFARRHLDGCAAMRCLGVSQGTLRSLFIGEFLVVGLLGSAVGVVLGFGGHLVLLDWLGTLVDVELPAPSAWPGLQGIATGLVLLLGFAVPPLLPLTRVPPVHVIRRELGDAGRVAWIAYSVGVLLFAGLLVLAAGEWKLGGIVAGGFAGGLVVFGGIARVALWAAARFVRSERVGAGVGWRYALASLERRSGASALQITALGIGLMCLLLIAMTRSDLIAGWRQSTPPDAPNQFLIDIQPDQRAGVTDYLKQHGQADAALSPMVRGRLIAVNGKPVSPDNYEKADAKRLVDREFNLSYTTELPSDNRVVGGDWYGTDAKPQISIEEGLAKTIHVKLGDTMRFDVAGMQVEGPVTSVRKVDWNSFKVNFFVLMPPPSISDLPATFITSFHLPMGQQGLIDGLINKYPSVTAIDIAPILAQIQRVLEQVIGAVQFLFVFTLAAGVLVLYAALAGTRDERVHESALLRALGASHKQVRAVQTAEFVAVGALSGLMAALGAQGIGWVLASRVFEFHIDFNPWLVPAGIVAGVVCSGVGGWMSLRRVLSRPALQSLRDA